jgi:hypothetical protein
MRIKMLLSFLMLFVAVNRLMAQAEEKNAPLNNERNRKHIFKTNLLSALTQSASLSCENVLKPYSAIQAGVYYSSSYLLGGIERLSFTAEYRRYLPDEEHPLVGIYLAPYLKFQQLIHQEEDKNEKLTAEARIRTLGVGILVGRQWIAGRGFTVDMYGGIGYNPQVKLHSLTQIDKYHPYYFSERRWQSDIRLGMMIGYAF